MTISCLFVFRIIEFSVFPSREIRILREICIGSVGNVLIYSPYFVLQSMQKIRWSTYVLGSDYSLLPMATGNRKLTFTVRFDPYEVTQKFIFIQLIINILVFPRVHTESLCILVDLILSTVKL